MNFMVLGVTVRQTEILSVVGKGESLCCENHEQGTSLLNLNSLGAKR